MCVFNIVTTTSLCLSSAFSHPFWCPIQHLYFSETPNFTSGHALLPPARSVSMPCMDGAHLNFVGQTADRQSLSLKPLPRDYCGTSIDGGKGVGAHNFDQRPAGVHPLYEVRNSRQWKAKGETGGSRHRPSTRVFQSGPRHAPFAGRRNPKSQPLSACRICSAYNRS